MHHCYELFSHLGRKPSYKHILFLLFGTAEHLLVGFMPLDFFYSSYTHFKHPSDTWKPWWDLHLSLVYLICGSRFSFGWHTRPKNWDPFRSTWWSVIEHLLVHISVLFPHTVEMQKSVLLPFHSEICEICLELIFKQLFIVVITAAAQGQGKLLILYEWILEPNLSRIFFHLVPINIC